MIALVAERECRANFYFPLFISPYLPSPHLTYSFVPITSFVFTEHPPLKLCLTAAVAAASHGIGVLYLDTSNGCNVRRMQQIARSRYADANGVSERAICVLSK